MSNCEVTNLPVLVRLPTLLLWDCPTAPARLQA